MSDRSKDFGPIHLDPPIPEGVRERLKEKGYLDPKLSNPKAALGDDKLPLHLWPASATALGVLGLTEGMLKYGRMNWRPAGVRASTYVSACKRHLDAWFEGEEASPDSGIPHLGNALACLAILVDAMATGVLNDDRNYPGGYRAFADSLTPHVKRLRELFSKHSPRHYSIQDRSVPPLQRTGDDVL